MPFVMLRGGTAKGPVAYKTGRKYIKTNSNFIKSQSVSPSEPEPEVNANFFDLETSEGDANFGDLEVEGNL